MKKITIQIVLGMLCLNLSVAAQENLVARGLQPGQPLPPSADLTAYIGKLLIIDFWATWCAPCRAMIPRTDALNEQFAGKAIILPVTYETQKMAGAVLQKIRKSSQKSSPALFSDTTLSRLFPHRTLPHYVWIDPKGTVRAITEEGPVNAESLQAALTANRYPDARKEDLSIAYDSKIPLFTGSNGGKGEALRYHSLLAGYVPGLPPGLTISRFDSLRGQTFNVRNVPLLWLFRLAYHENNRWFAFSRIRNRSVDSAAMRSPGSGAVYEQWLASGAGYCYELKLPPSLARQAFPMIRADLDRLFPQYALSVEKVKTRCLVLVRTGNNEQFIAKKGQPYEVKITPFACKLQNATLHQLMVRLEHQFLQLAPLPLTDETGYTGRADIDFNADMTKPGSINQGLAPFGLALVERLAETEMLVIRDRPIPKP